MTVSDITRPESKTPKRQETVSTESDLRRISRGGLRVLRRDLRGVVNTVVRHDISKCEFTGI